MNILSLGNKMWEYFKSRVKIFLDKPGRKWLFGLMEMLFIFVKKRKFTYIFFNQGVWVCKYKDEVIVSRKLNCITLDDYEEDAKDNWLSIYKPKPGDIIFDIGAGNGGDTYCFSKLVTSYGKVFSIEAHPKTFLCLSKFCEYNKLKNVVPLNLAICDKESEVMIDNPDSDISSTIVNVTNGFRVKGVPLDLIVTRFAINTIDFIKMNTEGAESKALCGMVNCIKKTRYICISCHDFKANRTGNEYMCTKNEVLNFLRQNNFRIVLREYDYRPWIKNQINGINENLI